MSYKCLKTARNLYALKNGQLLESGISLDFFLIPSQFSEEMDRCLQANSYSGMKSLGYYSDARYPSVDNPSILKSYLSTFKTFAGASSSLCKSTYLYDLLTTVNDEVIIYSMTTGASYGFGWKYAENYSPLKVLYPVVILNGTKYVGIGSPQTIGIASGNEARVMAWGVMIDPVTKEGNIYIGRVSYHTPEQYYDSGSVIPCEVRGVADMKLLVKALFFDMPPEPVEDPYDSDNYGPGENQGGDGNGDDTSDTILVPANPTLQMTSSGMVTIFTPTLTQIQDLATKLIDPNFFQALGNVFAPLDEVILGLHVVPLAVPYTGPTSAISINLLGIAYRVGTELNKASAQILDVDCGTLIVSEFWGNCLDYNPYTKITIFLPFIGYIDIDADDVMGKTVGIKYKVDIATGACIAFITADGSVMYQYAGNCALTIPVSSNDQSSAIQNIVSIATAAVTGGAGIAAAGAAVAEAEGALNAATGYKEIKAAISERDQAKAHYDSVSEKNKGKLAGVSANAVVNSKAQFHHGGSLGASAGFMGIKKPYMIIRRPKQMIPDMYGAFNGYPTNTYVKLDDLIGYTRVSDIRLNIPDATVDEILECERLLKEGVVL